MHSLTEFWCHSTQLVKMNSEIVGLPCSHWVHHSGLSIIAKLQDLEKEDSGQCIFKYWITRICEYEQNLIYPSD